MSDQTDSARPWKFATFGLAAVCAGLLAFIVLQSQGPIDSTVAAGKVTDIKKAPNPTTPVEYGPAPVSLRKFEGPEELVGEAKKAMQTRLDKAENLTYKAAGVKSLDVDARIVDRSKVSPEDTEVMITMQLLVIKQPSNSLLASISATAAAGLGSGASENFVKRTKVSVLESTADVTFEDLVATLKTPPDEDEDEEEEDDE